ncbi:DUF2510 domain-containing protein [Cellulosimicrobium sp. 22601]|uniref:DUF2510 domain-containing protein n=1 Tax=unclassified Cellulosimicrobium TaxID=2624466 RepID=UPI003F82E721
MSGPPVPGWYPDPWGVRAERWFDGRAWTPHVRDRPAGAGGPRTMRPGAIVAIVLGVLLALAVVAAVVVFFVLMVQGVVCGEAPHYCD